MEPLQQAEVDSCSICLEPLSSPENGESEDLSRTPCNHPFHQNCLKEWFINGYPGHWCPLCKRPLSPVERFDALFGGGTCSGHRSAEELDALLEQRTAEEFGRLETADQRLTEARTNYNLALQRNLDLILQSNQDADQLLAGYKRLSESLQWLEKDKMELEKVVNYLENKRQGTSAQGQLVAQQVVARRQRKYDRDIKRYRQENQGVKILEKRHQEVRKQVDEDDKVKEELGRHFEEETDRFEVVRKRYEIAELILMQ